MKQIAILDDYQNLALKLADWSPVLERAQVTVFDRHLSAAEAPHALAGFDAVCHLRERMAMPRKLIEALPRLRFMVVTGREHRTLDLAAAQERGIVLSMAPNGSEGATATPELAWGLILSLARHIPQAAAAMREGGWQRHCGRVLRGKTLGLVGFGRLGQAMAPIAHAFGMRVLAWSANLTPEAATAGGAEYATKEALLTASDFVSLHLVLSERSRHTLGAADFARMKPTACLVNTARAGLVDRTALLAALQTGHLAGAGLDVFDEEPLPDDDAFRRLDRVVLTPHLGYTVEESLANFYRGTVEALGAWLDGAPIRLVTPSSTPSAGTQP